MGAHLPRATPGSARYCDLSCVAPTPWILWLGIHFKARGQGSAMERCPMSCAVLCCAVKLVQGVTELYSSHQHSAALKATRTTLKIQLCPYTVYCGAIQNDVDIQQSECIHQKKSGNLGRRVSHIFGEPPHEFSALYIINYFRTSSSNEWKKNR